MIELKVKVSNLEVIREKLTLLPSQIVGAFHQVDTYYVVPKGRLKLREVVGEANAELIYYERENIATLKDSSVFILKISQPQTFQEIATKILKVKAVVDKVREIYNYNGTQIHLDKVKSLGHFIEFERITSHYTRLQDISKIDELIEILNITPEDMVAVSYSDLV